MFKFLDNVLSDEECLKLIELSEENFTSATILDKNDDGSYRTAESFWFYEDNFITEKIKNIVSSETNLPIENQENVHIVKYKINGEYKEHHDFFHPGEYYFADEIKKGGQRVYSCLIYLNDNFTGGETHFLNKNLNITPKKGTMVIWNNLKEDGSPDYDTLHAGLPVISGEKYICLVWVREFKYNLYN